MSAGVADLHVHTPRCGHAIGSAREYVARALEIGLAELGFADHLPLVGRVDASLAMSADALPGYVEEVLAAALEAPQEVRVRLGVEADYVDGTQNRVAEMLAAHPFDYVLGSVHFLGDWAFDHPAEMDRYEGMEPTRFWEWYFETAAAAAGSGLFDVMAHPDLAKKFDVWPDFDPSYLYGPFADAVAATGVAAEINTAGLFKPVGEIYPTRGLLEELHSRGVAITFGSDAHAASDVGRAFGDAVALAWEVGYREAVTFEKRRPMPYPLEAP
jgi:histidinol-phosphatase (PHP family)